MQSRPSSVYEKRHPNHSARNEQLCKSNRNEPIYEPILPPVPPPLPKKPWEIDVKDDECEDKTEISLSKESNSENRGPTPLQRSPFMDNVALKALDEEKSLKIKEDSLADDIVDQLTQISLLTKQHMSEQGLVKQNVLHNQTKEEIRPHTFSSEKVHTLRYESGILNLSGGKCSSELKKISSLSQSQNIKKIDGDESETTVTDVQMTSNLDLNAQALEESKSCVDKLHDNSFIENENNRNYDTYYTKVSKTENIKANVTPSTIELSNISDDLQPLNSNTLGALKVLSSSGDELPFIDESRGNDESQNLNIVTGGSSACGAKQKRILPTVQEQGKYHQDLND